MSEQEFKAIFSRNLKRYMSLNNITQVELAKKIGVGTSSVSDWVNGRKTPRMDKIDAMCELFGIMRSDLISSDSEPEYYYSKDTAEMAQQIFESKELRGLFDAARDADPEDLKAVHDMLLALKRKERRYSDDGC